MFLQECELRLYARDPIMCMQHFTFKRRPLLSPSQIADLRLAASNMSGPTRRAFEAEMTVKYCGGNPLMAEAVFGWGRQTFTADMEGSLLLRQGLGSGRPPRVTKVERQANEWTLTELTQT